MNTTSSEQLYCALRENDVPAEKARAVVNAVPAEKAQAVVNALKATRNKATVRDDAIEHTSAFMSLREPELQKLRDELLELLIQDALRSEH